MKVLLISMIAVGISLLIFSLIPSQKICQRQNRVYKDWKWLCGLICFFILGYILYINILINSQPTTQDLIVTTILLGVSIFVVLVVHLSLASIRRSDYLALHDELTELPNRILLEERLDHGLLVAKRQKEPLALLLMDLVRFK